jgi:hypothetical protein
MFCDIIYMLVRLNKGFLLIVKKNIEFRKLISTEYNIIIFYIYYNYKKLNYSIIINIQLKKKIYSTISPPVLLYPSRLV